MEREKEKEEDACFVRLTVIRLVYGSAYIHACKYTKACMRTSTLEHAACTMRRTVRHVLAATVRQQEYGNRLRSILPSLFYLLSLGYFPTSEFNSCNVESPTTRCSTDSSC